MNRSAALGLMWGFVLGMATCRALDHLEASSHQVVKHHPAATRPPVPV